MRVHDLILLVISKEEGRSLRGRTLLQKKLYFLSMLKRGDFGFRPHYYGPYSSWVAENLNTLVGIGFLKEITETFPAREKIFGEVRRHTYSLIDHGETVMHEIEKEKSYEEWKEVIERFNAQSLAGDFNRLSIAAKVHYILIRTEESVTSEQIQSIAEQYKWRIQESDLDGVMKFLVDLSLVSVSR